MVVIQEEEQEQQHSSLDRPSPAVVAVDVRAVPHRALVSATSPLGPRLPRRTRTWRRRTRHVRVHRILVDPRAGTPDGADGEPNVPAPNQFASATRRTGRALSSDTGRPSPPMTGPQSSPARCTHRFRAVRRALRSTSLVEQTNTADGRGERSTPTSENALGKARLAPPSSNRSHVAPYRPNDVDQRTAPTIY